jgi:hypothetical protein
VALAWKRTDTSSDPWCRMEYEWYNIKMVLGVVTRLAGRIVTNVVCIYVGFSSFPSPVLPIGLDSHHSISHYGNAPDSCAVFPLFESRKGIRNTH